MGCGFPGCCGLAFFFGFLGFSGCGGVLAEFAASFSVVKDFDDVAYLDVLVAGEVDSALDALTDFADVVLEALEGGDLALPDLVAFAEQADLLVATDEAVGDAAAGDLADLGDLEDVEDLGAAGVVLLEDWLEEAVHRLGDLVLQLVDDGVQTDLDVFALGDLGGLAIGPDVEADDDGVRGGGEQDVGLGDGADAGVQDADANLLGGHALRASRRGLRRSPARRP